MLQEFNSAVQPPLSRPDLKPDFPIHPLNVPPPEKENPLFDGINPKPAAKAKPVSASKGKGKGSLKGTKWSEEKHATMKAFRDAAKAAKQGPAAAGETKPVAAAQTPAPPENKKCLTIELTRLTTYGRDEAARQELVLDKSVRAAQAKAKREGFTSVRVLYYPEGQAQPMQEEILYV